MNGSPLPAERRDIHARFQPRSLWTPPQPNDPGYARWYEMTEMLDANEPEIPNEHQH